MPFSRPPSETVRTGYEKILPAPVQPMQAHNCGTGQSPISPATPCRMGTGQCPRKKPSSPFLSVLLAAHGIAPGILACGIMAGFAIYDSDVTLLVSQFLLMILLFGPRLAALLPTGTPRPPSEQ